MKMKMKKKTAEEGSEAAQASESDNDAPDAPPNRGISKLDFVMRIVAAIATLGSAIAVGTSSQMLHFIRRFRVQQHHDLPAFSFYVVSNAVTCGYLVLSLALSIFHILKSGAKVTRTVLIVLDMIILSLLTAGASAAAAVVHLAHKGDVQANWFAICQHSNTFCERVSGSLVGSFIGILVLMLLILLSAVAMSRV
ncbi:casparian strip membrane protein 1-like [Andrographis paniculata]|uniref:casparian strip membrane protein 1-like n=1 Tax=Andrographis paniculata TaxID=175694 RepID=UPI0021E6F878|nr:casparian strip membrane protein 1-like [Andrographis paniculata]